ncbi:MAG TPA: IS256 family transposase [Alphaproteobacteria bacterium]|nr:IS256 family transposase [Alphaproteobacteria bacterium]
MEHQTTPQGSASSHIWERLEAFVREQVQRFIQALLEEEITALLGRPKSARRAGVDAPQGLRNGYGKPRRLSLSLGTITVRRPRVRGLGERFVSRVLPLFQRRTREVGELLPRLYLHGLALGDFELALRGLLGEAAPLSATSLARLKANWQLEYEAWKQRRLDDLEVVYVWADGLYVKAGLEDTKAALLVMIGALTTGQKIVLAVESGQRESKESWGAVRRDLRTRGLRPWRCTIADGHLGIWAALAEQQPTAAEQRCWNHRITNVVDAIPNKQQAQARTLLCAMPYAESQAACEQLRTQCAKRYRQVAPKAVERLAQDWDRLVTCYQFPRDHWRHLRTTNVVESPFAAARLRTSAAKRFTKVDSATAMIWKLLQVAEGTFRRLNAPELLPAVYAGVKYVNGINQIAVNSREVAA